MASQAVEGPRFLLPAQEKPCCSTASRAEKAILRKVVDEGLDGPREF